MTLEAELRKLLGRTPRIGEAFTQELLALLAEARDEQREADARIAETLQWETRREDGNGGERAAIVKAIREAEND